MFASVIKFLTVFGASASYVSKTMVPLFVCIVILCIKFCTTDVFVAEAAVVVAIVIEFNKGVVAPILAVELAAIDDEVAKSDVLDTVFEAVEEPELDDDHHKIPPIIARHMIPEMT